MKADASGFLNDLNEDDGFVTGIKTLADYSELRQQFGKQGREIVRQKFIQDVLVNEFERAITESV